jgi:choline dehydrogenase-like flavoprotein
MIAEAHGVENGQILQSDICIVGAGAAGISLALQFEHGPQNILVLESGGRRSHSASQALNRGSLAGTLPHPPPHRFRRRGFGGATAIWGGRCVPFDPIDFAHRPWMPGTPWPIAYEALLPYYEHAAKLCEIGDFDFAAKSGFRPVLPGFRQGHFTQTSMERFSCPTHFGARYGARLEAATNITVLLHATVLEIRTTSDGCAASSLSVATLAGRRFTVQAKSFVLATGGLEVPRLLLASRDHQPQGIGNASGLVGRCYMTHLAGTIGAVVLPPQTPAPFLGYEVSDDGVYCRRRFALTPDSQHALRCGNAIARLHHPRLSDPAHRSGALSAVQLAKPLVSFEYRTRLGTLTGREMLGHLRNLAQDFSGATRFAGHWLSRHCLATRKYPSLAVSPRQGPYSLDLHAEQAANPQSRITLGQDRDALGVQKINIDWRCTDTDTHTLRSALAALSEDFAKSGCAALLYDPAELETMILREGAYGGHHIGTARMAASPRDGVVDSSCRVFGMRNLFIAGSAIFSTSSQANPTLTLVALALRLADELKKTVAHGPEEAMSGFR